MALTHIDGPSSSSSAPARGLLVELHGLSKRYGDRWVLRDASFAIQPGEILGLIGPNGSGKTTLFECVAGTAYPTVGQVTSDGQALTDDARKQTLFFVPDGIRPWRDQTLRTVLDLMRAMFPPDHAPAVDPLAALNLQRHLDAPMRTLSKGEHKRAMLALGLISTPPLLMLDEPFDGLDLRQTRDVMGVLRAHRDAGRTMLLSIHQLGDAARVCDRFVLLNGGRVTAIGTLDQLRVQANRSTGDLEDVFLALT